MLLLGLSAAVSLQIYDGGGTEGGHVAEFEKLFVYLGMSGALYLKRVCCGSIRMVFECFIYLKVGSSVC